MPCTTFPEDRYPQHKTVTFMEWMTGYLNEPNLIHDSHRYMDMEGQLCDKIRKNGGSQLMDAVRRNYPDDKTAIELCEWWKQHEWRDRIRQRFKIDVE